MTQAIAPDSSDSEQFSPVADPWDTPEKSEPAATWYLGIDLGESSIAAVLWRKEAVDFR